MATIDRFRSRILVVVMLMLISGNETFAIDVVIDYTYDTSSFFGSGNPSGAAAGAQAKATIESVATFYSNILDDTFSAIETPPNFQSSAFNGEVSWFRNQTFSHPATGGQVTIPDLSIAADQYTIYAGSRPIAGSTLGIGGPGGGGWGNDIISQSFTTAEIAQIDQITADFFAAAGNRGETSGFANWGGAVTFDTDTNWHYDASSQPSGNSDFLSIAIHEIGHAMGLGASSEWNALISNNGTFFGSAAIVEFGGAVPVDPGRGHWADGTMSAIYGTNTPQEAAMDPVITTGTRKIFTNLDAAGLTDIGWTVVPEPVSGLACDFDGDGKCDPADLNALYANFSTNASAYDVNNDSTVDSADVGAWLAAASSSTNAFNTGAKTFVLGDVDLNGSVDSTDLGLLLNNFASTGGLLYGSGNLNDDPNVDSTDLGLLLNNFAFASTLSAVTVPEPRGAFTLFLLPWAVFGFFRKSSA